MDRQQMPAGPVFAVLIAILGLILAASMARAVAPEPTAAPRTETVSSTVKVEP